MKNIARELFELDRLLKDFAKLKAKHLTALRLRTPKVALARIEDELEKIQKNIHKKDAYTHPRRHINWN